MKGKNSKLLIIFISVLMVCLIVSTAPTAVAAGDWGTLDAGDEMKWKLVPDPVDYPNTLMYMEVEVVGISGTDMTYNYQVTVVYDSSTYSWSGTDTDDEVVFFAFSQSELQKMKADAETDPDVTWTETDFSWKGDNYETYYVKSIDNSDTYESWIDKGSGITLEMRWTTGGTTYTMLILESTTASLASAGFCLGTILIAFVSVATLVAYSIVRYQKKKRI